MHCCVETLNTQSTKVQLGIQAGFAIVGRWTLCTSQGSASAVAMECMTPAHQWKSKALTITVLCGVWQSLWATSSQKAFLPLKLSTDLAKTWTLACSSCEITSAFQLVYLN